MDQIKIQIEVNLGEKTQETLKEFSATIAAGLIAVGGKKEDFMTAMEGRIRDAALTEEAKPAEEPAPAADPEPVEDMPEDIADAWEPAPMVTDQELIDAVALTKKTVSPKAIKDLFSSYDIPCSTKCPHQRRRSLLKDLEDLRNAQ